LIAARDLWPLPAPKSSSATLAAPPTSLRNRRISDTWYAVGSSPVRAAFKGRARAYIRMSHASSG
jgi:hypothetical protein